MQSSNILCDYLCMITVFFLYLLVSKTSVDLNFCGLPCYLQAILAGCIPITFFRDNDLPWQVSVDRVSKMAVAGKSFFPLLLAILIQLSSLSLLQNFLDYHDFSINIDPSEIHLLHKKIDSVNTTRLVRMQKALQGVQVGLQPNFPSLFFLVCSYHLCWPYLQPFFQWDSERRSGVQFLTMRSLWERARELRRHKHE